jgi:hypothetical protein
MIHIDHEVCLLVDSHVCGRPFATFMANVVLSPTLTRPSLIIDSITLLHDVS